MTTSGYMCSVGSRLGDPWTLATYALGVLDALAPTRYPGSCPDRLLCRTLPDGRIMVLQLHLAGGEVPERYRGTAEEGGGAGLGGVVTTMVATPERLAVVAAEWHAARARLVERSGWTAVDDATGPDGGR